MNNNRVIILLAGSVLSLSLFGCSPAGDNNPTRTNSTDVGGVTNASMAPPPGNLRNVTTNVSPMVDGSRVAATNVSGTVVATAVLAPTSGSSVQGTVNFIQSGDRVRVEATLAGLTPGQHGFHIHEKGDCSAPDAASAGGHFNPSGMQHGGPGDSSRHVGDFGNLEADAQGSAKFVNTFADLKFEGAASIIGRAVIVHAKADDLKTQPTGDAGGRVACGVIQHK